MVDARGWGPFLLGGLPLLDDILPAAWCARGSDPWKLEPLPLRWGLGRSSKVDFHSLAVSTLKGWSIIQASQSIVVPGDC